MSNSTSNAGIDALRQAISSGSNAAAALSAMVAASRGSSSTTAPSAASAAAAGSASSSTANEQVDQKPSAQELAKENEGQDDGHEVDDTPMEVDSKADIKPAALGDVKSDVNDTLSVGGQKREPPALRAGFLLGDGAGMVSVYQHNEHYVHIID